MDSSAIAFWKPVPGPENAPARMRLRRRRQRKQFELFASVTIGVAVFFVLAPAVFGLFHAPFGPAFGIAVAVISLFIGRRIAESHLAHERDLLRARRNQAAPRRQTMGERRPRTAAL